jgi:uroporphyrinogen-III decarboxylase
VLLGSLNPVTELMGVTPEEVRRLLAERHGQAGSRWIVGAGCEVPRGTPPANLDAMTGFARSTRP